MITFEPPIRAPSWTLSTDGFYFHIHHFENQTIHCLHGIICQHLILKKIWYQWHLRFVHVICRKKKSKKPIKLTMYQSRLNDLHSWTQNFFIEAVSWCYVRIQPLTFGIAIQKKWVLKLEFQIFCDRFYLVVQPKSVQNHKTIVWRGWPVIKKDSKTMKITKCL